MCGISGFFSANGDVDASRYYSAHKLLRHRGPDDEGFLAAHGKEVIRLRGDDSVAESGDLRHIENLNGARLVLGHRRLSILDLSYRGHQPFEDPTGRYFMVYNGEVFNYVEIRHDLEARGHLFASGSDTEVVLAAYSEWGDACFDKLNGMWALVIWDRIDDSILLSRDPFGIKPLYFTEDGGLLSFASEMKFLLHFGGRRRSLNTPRVADYLHRMLASHTDETFWHGIFEVQPGTCMRYREGRIESIPYWRYRPALHDWDLKSAVERFGDLFEDSLRIRMRSDVAVGSLLSGGLDSSLIVCGLAATGATRGDGALQTYTIDFAEKQFSERSYVEDVAAVAPVNTDFVRPDLDQFEESMGRLLWHIEEPFRSLSQYSQLTIYDHIDRVGGARVLLNGQGGDELFGGYTAHYFIWLTQLAATGRFGRLAWEVASFALTRRQPLGRIANRVRGDLGQARLAGEAHFNMTTYGGVVGSPLREYLKYDDRTSMARGRETRPPFLDPRLVEFAFSLPANLKISGVRNKRVPREYARRIVPERIVNRTDKMGFVSPQEEWQRGILSEVISVPDDRIGDVVSAAGIDDAVLAAGRYQQYKSRESNDWAFAWRVYCLGEWLERNQSQMT